MAKKNKSKKNKKKNVGEASSENPIPNSTPPPPPLLLVFPAHPPPPVSPNLYNKMEDEAFAIATTAFEKYDCDTRIAEEIKIEFDSRYGRTWHCIVESSVSCEGGYQFDLYISPKDIILFKCG